MSRITPETFAAFAPHCADPTMAPALAAAADEFLITTRGEVCHWLGQISVESASFTRLVESLNYSAERLMAVWPHRFPTLADGAPYAHNPAALAEKVYGGRMGNTETGDGARYIGRGLLMNTGREGYARAGLLIGVDLLDHPELLETPAIGARAAGAFWSDHDLNALAEMDDIVGITHAINGELTGLTERQAAVARAKAIWSA